MRYRRRAPCGPKDKNQAECVRAIQLLGLLFMDLSGAGGGIGDLLVLIPERRKRIGDTWLIEPPYFVEVECKVPSRKDGGVKPSKFTKAQREWREKTKGAPRETVTSFEDTLAKLRARMS